MELLKLGEEVVGYFNEFAVFEATDGTEDEETKALQASNED